MVFQQIRMVVFDLDGTLVDSMGRFADVAQAVMARHFSVTPEQARLDYQRTSGLPFVYQLQTLFPSHPQIPMAVDEFESLKLEGYDLAPFFSDIEESLLRLKQSGLKLAVSSNNHETNVERKISGLQVKFDEVMGFREGFCKGDSHFGFLCRRHALRHTELFFVGDSLHDARMAHKNGVSFGARLGTFQAGDFLALDIPLRIVKNYFELCDLLEA